MKNTLSTVLLFGFLGLVLASSGRAQITITFAYNGTNTILNYTVAPGSLASLTASGTATPSAEHTVANGGLVNVTGVTMDVYTNPGFTNTNWGTPSVAATSFSGDEIRFFQGSSGVRVPAGFDRVNGTLTGSMTWNTVSLTDLGFATNSPTSGSFAALGTTVNWSTTNSAIPEPGTYAALAGLSVLGFAVHRRRRRPVG